MLRNTMGYAGERIGEVAHPGPARIGPYDRGGILDDFIPQIRIHKTFIEHAPATIEN
jgi:hypothetical protein